MKKEDIVLSDWQRILFGEAPVAFLLEVAIRSVITYVVLLVVLKLLGKRMSGRLTNTEMAVMLMFGAVVSSAMQIPDRGILEGCFVLLLILLFQRVFTLWMLKSRSLEKSTLSTTSLIVKNGVIQPGFMNKELLSQNQLFRKLRKKGIFQLGEVKRVYMETNGSFSIIKNKEVVAGLPVLPKEDKEILKLFTAEPSKVTCGHCGHCYEEAQRPPFCSTCHSGDWLPAMIKNKQE